MKTETFIVTLRLEIDPAESYPDPAEWNWTDLLDIKPHESVEVLGCVIEE